MIAELRPLDHVSRRVRLAEADDDTLRELLGQVRDLPATDPIRIEVIDVCELREVKA